LEQFVESDAIHMACADLDLLASPTHALILAVVQELPSPDHQQADVLDDVGIELGFELGRALLVFQNAEPIEDLASRKNNRHNPSLHYNVSVMPK
jgi:hypothetical protein